MRFRTVMALTGALALSLTAGCAKGDSVGSASNTVTYWLWDSNQLPAYQACAKDFEQQNPGLKVKITQLGWADYWTKLTASFIAGTQPDVFTDHIQKFGQFADLKVLQPLDDLDIDASAYQPGLAANWQGQDGHRYGAPKDWDTVALFYNQKMAKSAGLDADQLNSLSWNPTDGGTFEKAIAHLTIDRNGKRGDEPGFDKHHVKVYGMATGGAGDSDGQTTWSPFTASAELELHGQEALGHELPVRQQDVPVDDQVVLRTGEEGLSRAVHGLQRRRQPAQRADSGSTRRRPRSTAPG